MEQLYNKKIADIDDKALEKLSSVKKEITTQNKLLKKIDKFNEIQARKYLNASDRVIDKELKDQYQNFLEKHEE